LNTMQVSTELQHEKVSRSGIGGRQRQSQAHNDIGEMYEKEGKLDLARQRYLNSLAIKEKSFGNSRQTTASTRKKIIITSPGANAESRNYYVLVLSDPLIACRQAPQKWRWGHRVHVGLPEPVATKGTGVRYPKAMQLRLSWFNTPDLYRSTTAHASHKTTKVAGCTFATTCVAISKSSWKVCF